MVSSKYIVRAKDLTKIYDGKKVVNKINVNVVRGEIFGILGPNGAGKTAALEMMETIRPIDGGAVIIDGFNVANQQQKIKSIIGVQPQSPAFQDKTKLREIIELFGAAYGRKVNSENLLNQVDLIEKANSYVEDLSGGQKQRLSIAASLVHSPSVFFLDEPTTGLDPQARRHLWNLIESIRRSGVTIIMTTHYMDEAEKLCDRVAIMDEGKIVALDTPDVMIKNLLAKGFKKKRIVEQANLEDVFIDLTGKHLRE